MPEETTSAPLEPANSGTPTAPAAPVASEPEPAPEPEARSAAPDSTPAAGPAPAPEQPAPVTPAATTNAETTEPPPSREPAEPRARAPRPSAPKRDTVGDAAASADAASESSTEGGDEPGSGEGESLGPDGLPRKRRRRGSRGGRNRRRSGTGAGGEGAGAEDDDAEFDASGDLVAGASDAVEGDATEGPTRARPATRPPRAPRAPRVPVVTDDDSGAPGPRPSRSGPVRPPRLERREEDWTDAGADRGLTSDDLGEAARRDAGLDSPEPGERPRIGDSRPAPVPAASGGGANGGANGSGDDEGDGTGTKRRRRRRGGRGRTSAARTGESTTERTGNRNGGRPKPGAFVEADLGIDDDFELDDATMEKRKGRSRKGRPSGRYLMTVHVGDNGPTQIAILEGRALTEHYVSWPEDDDTSIDGNIYLGKVQNVLPGMEAAFIDIGTPKNGVLYRGDVAFDPADVETKGERPKIEQMIKNGQSILVQVTKNPIGHKGARLTQEVSLAGRFVVMVPNQPDTYGISKRLPDDERKRLRRILEGLRPPDAGLIVRTAAEGATAEELERDMRRLKHQWEQISALAARSKGGTLLYREPALVTRVIREEFTKEYRGVIIDSPELFKEVKGYVEAIAPELAERVELYDEELPIFERHHVHEQLVKALDKKVWLASGGSLIIERTEALTVIDVNTGKNVGKNNLEDTVFRNNMEAAEEVARQLRLRDIGGIIVIDFIDMEIRDNRDVLVRHFKECLARDKTRTQVFDVSELGLVEMTRKRISEGLVEAFSSGCEVCAGRGFVVNEQLLGGSAPHPEHLPPGAADPAASS
jgi:ribonuclease E